MKKLFAVVYSTTGFGCEKPVYKIVRRYASFAAAGKAAKKMSLPPSGIANRPGEGALYIMPIRETVS